MGCFKAEKQKESKSEKVAKRTAKAQWADYKARFVPVENKFIESVQGLQRRGGIERLSAAADTSQAFEEARKRAEIGDVSRGVDPTSGAGVSARADRGLRKARATSGGVNDARLRSQQRFIEGLGAVVSAGKGVASDANLSMRNAASTGFRQAGAAAANEDVLSGQIADLAGSAAGAATNIGAGFATGGGFRSAFNKASTFAGSKFDTGFGSQQSRMLAEQEF